MFAPAYFPPGYFAPTYFPPGFEPSGGGPAAGIGVSREQILREDEELIQLLMKIVEECLLD